MVVQSPAMRLIEKDSSSFFVYRKTFPGVKFLQNSEKSSDKVTLYAVIKQPKKMNIG